MSQERLRQNGDRWIRQASDDLAAAEALAAAGQYAQACFWAQQVAEKALKSYWIVHDLEAWGHSVTRLIDDLPVDRAREEFASLRDAALYLDKLYIPTRYPDAIAELTPSEAYTRREAETAIDHARSFLDQVQRLLGEMPN